MKVTLAIVLAVLTCSALSAAPRTQSPQQSAPAAETPPPAASQASPPQQEPPQPQISQPCAESKDTCEVMPEQTTVAPVPKVEEKEEKKEAKPPSDSARRSSKKSRRHKSTKKQETVAAQDPTAPKKIVVRQGGTSEPTTVLTPGATARGSYSPQMTADLLSATDANLKEASARPLTSAQEQTVSQIKLFMEEANAAVKAGDLDRGHNLAFKARLLSDDLVKH